MFSKRIKFRVHHIALVRGVNRFKIQLMVLKNQSEFFYFCNFWLINLARCKYTNNNVFIISYGNQSINTDCSDALFTTLWQ